MAIFVSLIFLGSFVILLLEEEEQSDKSKLLDTEYAFNGSYIVHTGMEGAAPVLDKEQLTAAIQAKYTGQAKINLIGVIDDLIYIQDEYNVNGVFAIAVAQQESACGTSWAAIAEETCNWMSVTGSYNGQTYRNPSSTNTHTWRVYDSFNTATRDFGDLIANGTYYFQSGKYDVNSIAVSYCNESWGTAVNNHMTEIYKAAGIEIATAGGTIGEKTADGYGTFISNGRRYIEYKQTKEEYKGIRYCHTEHNNSLYAVGCAITSDAIIGSGFGSKEDPLDVRNYCASNYSMCNHAAHLSRLTGLNWEKIDGNASWTEIAATLKRGYPVMLAFKGSGKVLKTGTEHRVAILGISEDGTQVYISDPGTNAGTSNGWHLISDLKDITILSYCRVK